MNYDRKIDLHITLPRIYGAAHDVYAANAVDINVHLGGYIYAQKCVIDSSPRVYSQFYTLCHIALFFSTGTISIIIIQSI